ncbi:unnamed protein product [marine sediment metagenome]|uniref:Uncharacterized protein n=1 Tax=marine sediment metagenome TaxID=412755 RepID=X1DDZ3_9ZZZZ
MDRRMPRVAPAIPRKILFFKEIREIGSLRTVVQLSQLIILTAFQLGIIEYGRRDV